MHICTPKGAKKKELPDFSNQMYMENPKQAMVCDKLQSVDVNTLTPIEAMNLLFELKSMMK